MDSEQDQKTSPPRFKSERGSFISILNFNNFILASMPNTYLLNPNRYPMNLDIFGLFLVSLLSTRKLVSNTILIFEIYHLKIEISLHCH